VVKDALKLSSATSDAACTQRYTPATATANCSFFAAPSRLCIKTIIVDVMNTANAVHANASDVETR
jgi:hypothetical protein